MAAEESEGRRGIGGWTLKHQRIRTPLLVSTLMPFCPFLFLCRHSFVPIPLSGSSVSRHCAVNAKHKGRRLAEEWRQRNRRGEEE